MKPAWFVRAFDNLPAMQTWLNDTQAECDHAFLELQVVSVVPDREGQSLILVARTVRP